jgi:hypothetical protein
MPEGIYTKGKQWDERFSNEQTGQSQNVPKRSPQIPVQMEILQKELAAQRDIIERLEGQLAPVLSVPPPDKTGNEPLAEPTCPIAAGLQNLAVQVSRNTQLISSIARRIEV